MEIKIEVGVDAEAEIVVHHENAAGVFVGVAGVRLYLQLLLLRVTLNLIWLNDNRPTVEAYFLRLHYVPRTQRGHFKTIALCRKLTQITYL